MESNFIGMALPLSLNAACIMLQFYRLFDLAIQLQRSGGEVNAP